jgi:hypothetical protein
VLQFRIIWLMIFIAIAALNFGAIRAWYQLRPDGNGVNNTVEVLTYGTLPMANLLAVGIIIGLRRPETRPFLWGFAAFGTLALVFFMPLAYFYTEEVVQPYILWFLRIRSVQKTVKDNFSPAVRIPIFYSIAALLVVLPQMAIALIGGFVFRRFRNDRATRPNPLPMGQ